MKKKTFKELTVGKSWLQLTKEDLAVFEEEFRAAVGPPSRYANDPPADLPEGVPLPSQPGEVVATFIKREVRTR